MGDRGDPEVILTNALIRLRTVSPKLCTDFRVMWYHPFCLQNGLTQTQKPFHLCGIICGSARPMPKLTKHHPRYADNIRSMA